MNKINKFQQYEASLWNQYHRVVGDWLGELNIVARKQCGVFFGRNKSK